MKLLQNATTLRFSVGKRLYKTSENGVSWVSFQTRTSNIRFSKCFVWKYRKHDVTERNSPSWLSAFFRWHRVSELLVIDKAITKSSCFRNESQGLTRHPLFLTLSQNLSANGNRLVEGMRIRRATLVYF